MQNVSRLVGLSNLSFLNSVSRGSQTDPSFTVSLFCCRSATRCAAGQQHDVLLLPCYFRAEQKAVICSGPFRKSARFSLCSNTR